MSQRKISFAAGEYYHLYNRGNSKQQIFHDEADYTRFMELLFVANSSTPFNIYNIRKDKSIFEWERDSSIISIGAYVIMPNHFHLLIRVPDNGLVSKFMQKLTTGYSMYYNQKYMRTGSLFEGTFKAEHITNNRYLKYLFSYIHLNPLKLFDPQWRNQGIQDIQESFIFLQHYKYSSYSEYIGYERTQKIILNIKDFPLYFPHLSNLKKELLSWITYRE